MVTYRSSHNSHTCDFQTDHDEISVRGNYLVSQKWKGSGSRLWICDPWCSRSSGGIGLTHGNRLAAETVWTRVPTEKYTQTLRILQVRHPLVWTSLRSQTSHLCILKCFMTARERCFDRQGSSINLTYTSSAQCLAAVWLSSSINQDNTRPDKQQVCLTRRDE